MYARFVSSSIGVCVAVKRDSVAKRNVECWMLMSVGVRSMHPSTYVTSFPRVENDVRLTHVDVIGEVANSIGHKNNFQL